MAGLSNMVSGEERLAPKHVHLHAMEDSIDSKLGVVQRSIIVACKRPPFYHHLSYTDYHPATVERTACIVQYVNFIAHLIMRIRQLIATHANHIARHQLPTTLPMCEMLVSVVSYFDLSDTNPTVVTRA